MKKNSKRRVLLFSILTIALCACLITGSTFALFTDTESVNIAVTAGNVEIKATINDGLKTWSLGETEANDRKGAFANGGSASLVGGELVIDRMTPGDTVKFNIDIQNLSNVAIAYRVLGVSSLTDTTVPDLSDALVISISVNKEPATDMTSANKSFTGSWLGVPAGNDILSVSVIVHFPNGTPEHDNPFMNGKASIAFTVEAVQSNGVDTNGNLILP